jgi:dihydrodipicolinate synthase/N-acetylneuraminate lyase
MKTSPIFDSEFSATVMAVPPLARRADYSLDAVENRKLIQHIEAGGVRTLLYGGNANLYHVAVSEYRELLDLLAESAGPETRVIPAIGADYGKMLDQARILAQTSYRTAMVLPLAGFTTSEGVEAGLTRIVDAAGIPLTLYIKSENYVDVDTLARLVETTICAACCKACRPRRWCRAWASARRWCTCAISASRPGRPARVASPRTRSRRCCMLSKLAAWKRRRAFTTLSCRSKPCATTFR